jgi:Transmembrane family 220, helix
MRALWIACNVLFLAMFLFSVVVQYNDPDPVRWMVIYGFAALTCLLELTRNQRWSLPAGIGLIALSWASSIVPHVHGVRIADLFAEFEMKNETVEQAREIGGLLIVAFWMLALTVSAWRRSRKKSAVAPPEAAQHV